LKFTGPRIESFDDLISFSGTIAANENPGGFNVRTGKNFGDGKQTIGHAVFFQYGLTNDAFDGFIDFGDFVGHDKKFKKLIIEGSLRDHYYGEPILVTFLYEQVGLARHKLDLSPKGESSA
jgi:hypothetical protein